MNESHGSVHAEVLSLWLEVMLQQGAGAGDADGMSVVDRGGLSALRTGIRDWVLLSESKTR